jgi:hypothetical protein
MTNDPKAKADNSGDPGNAEAANAHSEDSGTVFAKADPTTVDRDEDDGQYNAIAEVNRLREQVINAPAPGTDPDSRKRLGKTYAAAGEDVPGHLKTANDPTSDYPYDTDSDRLKDAGIPDHDNAGNPNPHNDDDATAKGTAATKRAATGVSRTATPQGRAATPTQKTAE